MAEVALLDIDWEPIDYGTKRLSPPTPGETIEIEELYARRSSSSASELGQRLGRYVSGEWSRYRAWPPTPYASDQPAHDRILFQAQGLVRDALIASYRRDEFTKDRAQVELDNAKKMFCSVRAHPKGCTAFTKPLKKEAIRFDETYDSIHRACLRYSTLITQRAIALYGNELASKCREGQSVRLGTGVGWPSFGSGANTASRLAALHPSMGPKPLIYKDGLDFMAQAYSGVTGPTALDPLALGRPNPLSVKYLRTQSTHKGTDILECSSPGGLLTRRDLPGYGKHRGVWMVGSFFNGYCIPTASAAYLALHSVPFHPDTIEDAASYIVRGVVDRESYLWDGAARPGGGTGRALLALDFTAYDLNIPDATLAAVIDVLKSEVWKDYYRKCGLDPHIIASVDDLFDDLSTIPTITPGVGVDEGAYAYLFRRKGTQASGHQWTSMLGSLISVATHAIKYAEIRGITPESAIDRLFSDEWRLVVQSDDTVAEMSREVADKWDTVETDSLNATTQAAAVYLQRFLSSDGISYPQPPAIVSRMIAGALNREERLETPLRDARILGHLARLSLLREPASKRVYTSVLSSVHPDLAHELDEAVTTPLADIMARIKIESGALDTLSAMFVDYDASSLGFGTDIPTWSAISEALRSRQYASADIIKALLETSGFGQLLAEDKEHARYGR